MAGYRTVNVRPDTYRRLRTYKVAGYTFDEVLAILMDHVDPRAIFEQALEDERPEAVPQKIQGIQPAPPRPPLHEVRARASGELPPLPEREGGEPLHRGRSAKKPTLAEEARTFHRGKSAVNFKPKGKQGSTGSDGANQQE